MSKLKINHYKLKSIILNATIKFKDANIIMHSVMYNKILFFPQRIPLISIAKWWVFSKMNFKWALDDVCILLHELQRDRSGFLSNGFDLLLPLTGVGVPTVGVNSRQLHPCSIRDLLGKFQCSWIRMRNTRYQNTKTSLSYCSTPKTVLQTWTRELLPLPLSQSSFIHTFQTFPCFRGLFFSSCRARRLSTTMWNRESLSDSSAQRSTLSNGSGYAYSISS